MRVDTFLQRSSRDVKGQLIDVADIEVDQPEEILQSNFSPLLQRIALAIHEGDSDQLKLVLGILRIVGLGSESSEDEVKCTHPHIDSVAAFGKLLKLLATPSNVVTLQHNSNRGHTTATSIDSLTAVGEVLQQFQQWLGALLMVADTLAVRAGQQCGMSDLMNESNPSPLGDAIELVTKTNPIPMLEGLASFVRSIVAPLCSVHSTSITQQQALTIRDALGQGLLPYLWTLLELCHGLLASGPSCGLLQLCGDVAAVNDLTMMGAVNPNDDSPSDKDFLTKYPSPVATILQVARLSATSVISLLKGSKENKRRLFTFTDVTSRRLYVSNAKTTSKALVEAFDAYQRDANTLLGRLLLPHPPVAALCSLPFAAQSATSRAASQQRGTAPKSSHIPLIHLLPPMLTNCPDPFLQLQLCEIAVRARMFKVAEFTTLITTRHFIVDDQSDHPDRFSAEQMELLCGPLHFYELLDSLLSQLPVSDPTTLFTRMAELLRDLNEFTSTDAGCKAVAAVVPPVLCRNLAWDGQHGCGGFEETTELSLLVASKMRGSTTNALKVFDSLRVEACFSPYDQQRNASVPLPLFEGYPVQLHFSGSFLSLEVAPQGQEGMALTGHIVVPYDTIRSVRLSKDKGVFVLRLDGGLSRWCSRLKSSNPQNDGSSLATPAFNEDYSHVFNIGAKADAEFEGHEESFEEVPSSRITVDLQREIIDSAMRVSNGDPHKLLASAINPIQCDTIINRLPDVVLHLVVTKGTSASLMASEVHKRIDRLRRGFGSSLVSMPLREKAGRGVALPEDDRREFKRHRSEPLSVQQPTVAVVVQPLELVSGQDTDLVTQGLSTGPVPHVTLQADLAPDSTKVLQMVATVLDEQSSDTLRKRRYALLEMNNRKIQAYIDAYRAESAQLEDSYVTEVNEALDLLQGKQKSLSGKVRMAVSELNEGVEFLRSVEESLRSKLCQVEESFESMEFTKPVKLGEMASLKQIKTIVDASVRSMETFIKGNINGSNPLNILKKFVASHEN